MARPRRVALQRIALVAMVMSESADSGDTPSRRQKTSRPLAITTADIGVAANATGESVAAMVTAASSTTRMRSIQDTTSAF